MTARAEKAPPHIACLSAGIALLCLLPMAAAAKDGPYLTWRAKAAPVQATDAPAMQTPQVPVPPSPYGQVGDPYAHMLTWGTKPGAAQPQQAVATATATRRAPVQQPATYATAPAEPARIYQAPRPNPGTGLMAQPYRTQPMPSTLAPPAQSVPRQSLPPVVAQTAPAPVPAAAPQVKRQPAAQIQAQAPAPEASADTGAYQVPASSPYAARIAAARAAQARALARAQAQTQAQPAAQPASPQAASAQTAAVTETPSADDKPFVPGQHYTDASDAPRLYSLHRAYGLKPDPITVDTNASGAILDTSQLDAAAAKAAQDEKANEKADEDSAGDDPQADGVPSGSSASGTQNASASKKAAQ